MIKVTRPFKAKERIDAGPASPAAKPVNTKIPAPIIAPTPIIVASKSPRSRAKVGCFGPEMLFISANYQDKVFLYNRFKSFTNDKL